VVVVGNGALGHATARALALADPTLRVAVVGRAARPLGASAAAGAMLGCFGEVTAHSRRSEAGRERLREALLARARWPGWLEGINAELAEADRLQVRAGTYVVTGAAPGTIEHDNYCAIVEVAREHASPGREPAEVDPRRIPGVSRPAALRALYLPDEGSLDAGRLLAAYERLARQRDRIQLIDDEVLKVRVERERIAGVALTSGVRLEAPHVVLAAGVATQRLLDRLPELARRIPRLFAGAGCAVELDTDVPVCPAVIRTPNAALSTGFHVLPRAGGRIYVGATNRVTADPIAQVDADAVAALRERLRVLDPGHEADRLAVTKAGNRPVTLDGLPLVGPTSLGGLWILSGTHRDGLFRSPLLGAALAQRILGGGAAGEGAFQPERRPIPSLTREEAVRVALDHFAGDRRRIDRLYDALELDFVIPPELLPMLEADAARAIPRLREVYAALTGAVSRAGRPRPSRGPARRRPPPARPPGSGSR
jgi:glycine/D-amino acid oxidase-like deaminating enzyme